MIADNLLRKLPTHFVSWKASSECAKNGRQTGVYTKNQCSNGIGKCYIESRKSYTNINSKDNKNPDN